MLSSGSARGGNFIAFATHASGPSSANRCLQLTRLIRAVHRHGLTSQQTGLTLVLPDKMELLEASTLLGVRGLMQHMLHRTKDYNGISKTQ
mmetsp:Transcript_33852/g.79131  ORF Transcript_33852/g.79131 Transcript_33852/m.79131 type:complete len:91 (+) Transcript_33852:969-1241(+)